MGRYTDHVSSLPIYVLCDVDSTEFIKYRQPNFVVGLNYIFLVSHLGAKRKVSLEGGKEPQSTYGGRVEILPSQMERTPQLFT